MGITWGADPCLIGCKRSCCEEDHARQGSDVLQEFTPKELKASGEAGVKVE